MSDLERGRRTGMKPQGFIQGDIPTVEQMPEVRAGLVDECIETIYQATAEIPGGFRVQPLSIVGYRQGPGNTCVLASSIAIRDSLLRRDPNLTLGQYSEQELVQLAVQEGIYLNDSEGRGTLVGQRTAEVLRRYLGINIERVHLAQSGDKSIIGTAHALISSALKGNLSILVYALGEGNQRDTPHAVVVSGLQKKTERDIQWLIMDPLAGRESVISTPQMSDRIVDRYSTLTRDGTFDATIGQLFTITLPPMPHSLRPIGTFVQAPPQVPQPQEREPMRVIQRIEAIPNKRKTNLRPLRYTKDFNPSE